MPQKTILGDVSPNVIYRDDMIGEKFTIKNASARADVNEESTLYIPLLMETCSCGHSHTEGYMAMEYAAVLFSPPDAAERIKQSHIPPQLIAAIEDIRQQHRMKLADINCPPRICPNAITAAAHMSLSAATATEFALNHIGVQALPRTFENTRMIEGHYHYELGEIIAFVNPKNEDDDDIISETNTAISAEHRKRNLRVYMAQALHGIIKRHITNRDIDNPPLFADTLLAAKEILEKIANQEREEYKTAQLEQKEIEKREEEKKWREIADRTKESAIEGIKTLEELEKEMRDKPEHEIKLPPPDSKEENSWGTMQIEEPGRSRRARATPVRKSTARDEGVIPSQIWRWSTDKRIFKQPARRKGKISVLVDCSASMSWDESHLRAFLDALPGSTIALYSGGHSTGTLRIVAKNGMRCTAEYMGNPDMGSNCIDGPALRWLAKQPGPRLWISDGEVTGIGDAGNATLRGYADRILKAAHISRARNAEYAIDIIEGRRPWGHTRCGG